MQSSRSYLLILLAAIHVTATEWPVPDWKTVRSPQSSGFSGEGLERYRAWLHKNISAKPWGTVIVRHGRVVFEDYGSGASRDSVWEIGSLRKSVYSSLIGIAIQEGKLTLDTPVHQIWPPIFDLTKQEKDKRILYRHLATATSGWRLTTQPGEFWRYDNLAFSAGHAALARLYNLPDDRIAPMVESRIRNVIGAKSWKVWHYEDGWEKSPGPKLAVDSNMRDLAKYGYLWLRKGRWRKRQVVPETYIAEASRNQVVHLGRHYGYLWMTNDGRVALPSVPADAFFHTGTGGERRTVLLICPSLDLVAVIGHDRSAYSLTPVDINDLKGASTGVDAWIAQVMAALNITTSQAR